MARVIDFTKPLNEEDAAYAADRPWLIEDAKLRGLSVNFEEDFIVEDEDVDSDDDGDLDDDSNDKGTSPDDEGDDEDDEDEESAYEDWSYPELKKELAERDLPTTGKKEQLIERLEEDDEDDDSDSE